MSFLHHSLNKQKNNASKKANLFSLSGIVSFPWWIKH